MKRKALSSFFLFLISMAGMAQCDPAFSVTTNGVNTVTVQSGASGPGIGHDWNFGNGVTLHTTQPTAVYVYSQPGMYLVKHRIYDSVNNCSDTTSVFVLLNFTPSCNADFTAVHNTSFYSAYTFQAQQPSPGAAWTNYGWKLNGQQVGTGSIYSSLLPDGSNTVCLIISNSLGCVDNACQTITVTPPACNFQASFTYAPSFNNSKRINFTSGPAGPGYNYSWSFGDGNSSMQSNPIHIYPQGGTYMVSLRVYKQGTYCKDTIMQAITVHNTAADSCTASFTVNPIPGNPSQRQLTAISNQQIISQVWHIDRLGDSIAHTTIAAFDPIYAFADSGHYQVCLAIGTSTGCQKLICDTIAITSPSGRMANNMLPSYPNPATNTVGVSLQLQQSTFITVRVYNTFGTLLYTSRRVGLPGLNHVSIPIHNLGRGQYYIDVEYNEQHKRSLFQKL